MKQEINDRYGRPKLINLTDDQSQSRALNTLKVIKNGHYFADDIFLRICYMGIIVFCFTFTSFSPWSKIYCFNLWCVTMRRWVNSWRPRDAIWWYKYGLTLAQVMVYWRLQAITWTNIDQHLGINSNYNDLFHYIQYKCFPKFPSYIQRIGGW